MLYRDEDGYTQSKRAADIHGVKELMDASASLGHLWMEDRFGLGTLLSTRAAPSRRPKG